MSNQKPLILVTNDDGVTAPGLEQLVKVALEFGEVVVVAPDRPQSGMGHAISVGKPLRLDRDRAEREGEWWVCSGTPADCVKLATGVLLKKKPDLVLSGINHGGNASISVFYSGTMSAAVEGTIEGVPSIGFSLCNFSWAADFGDAPAVVRKVLQNVIENGLGEDITLNVNIPYKPEEGIKGYRITRQAVGRWIEQFDKRIDPNGRDYYWLTGKFFTEDNGEDNDVIALSEGYVSICPVRIDITGYEALAALHRWDWS